MAAGYPYRQGKGGDLPLPDGLKKECPMFFKIILDPRADKLRIPPEFTGRLGCNPPKCVSLRVPSGSIWDMELIHDSDAQTWLCKGWPEFRQHYSVGLGHLLLFDYDGNSCFSVHIFDTSATEIDYSQYNPGHSNESHGRVPRKAQKLASHVRRGSRILTRSPYIRPDHDLVKLEGKEDIAMENLDTKRAQLPEKDVKYAARERALASMCHTPHSNPYCIVVMQPSYTTGHPCYLSMPRGFPERSFTSNNNNNNLILRDSEGRAWPVKCIIGRHRSKLTSGWHKFVEDNLLKLYDACFFQVDDRSNLVWNVRIFRC